MLIQTIDESRKKCSSEAIALQTSNESESVMLLIPNVNSKMAASKDILKYIRI